MSVVVESTDGFAVVGAVASGEESVAAVAELRPDLVLMDVNLPGIDGIEATRQIRRAASAPVVVLLSTHDEDDFDLSGCGAAAYISKSALSAARLQQVWSETAPRREPDPQSTAAVGGGYVEHSSARLDPVDDRRPAEGVHVDTADDEHELVAVAEGQADLAAGVLEHLHAAVVRRRLDVLGKPRRRDRRVDRHRVGPPERSGPRRQGGAQPRARQVRRIDAARQLAQ